MFVLLFFILIIHVLSHNGLRDYKTSTILTYTRNLLMGTHAEVDILVRNLCQLGEILLLILRVMEAFGASLLILYVLWHKTMNLGTHILAAFFLHHLRNLLKLSWLLDHLEMGRTRNAVGTLDILSTVYILLLKTHWRIVVVLFSDLSS